MVDYDYVLENVRKYIDKKINIISVLANLSAYIYQNIDNLNWVGFYLYDGEKLYLGPFSGKPAVTTIEIGSGVCGKSAESHEIIIVKNVHKFAEHIACDIFSKSEIVIPIITKNRDLFGVLDIDSPIENRFDNKIENTLKTIKNLLVDIL